MKATIDRIEGRVAVLLMGNWASIKLSIPIDLLPEGSIEGDILDININKDAKATEDAKTRVTNLIEGLKNKSK